MKSKDSQSAMNRTVLEDKDWIKRRRMANEIDCVPSRAVWGDR